jgi:hypothetical protein
VDRAELVRRLGGADPAWVLGIVGLVTADRLLMAWKWWLLVRGREAAVSLWAAVRTYYLASFAGFFLPMTLGADAVRVAALAGEGRTAGLVASVVLERALGALAQGVLALVAVGALVALGLGATIGPRERWMAAGVLVAAFLAFPLSFPLAGRAAGRLQAVGGWRGTLRALAAAYAGYAEAAGLVLVFFGLTLLEGCIPVVYHYMAGRALGLDLGFSLFVATVPLVFLVARLPVSLGGIGVLETSFVYLAGLLGLGRTEALSIALLAEAVVVVSLSPGALVYLFPSTGHPRDGWAARPRERLP